MVHKAEPAGDLRDFDGHTAAVLAVAVDRDGDIAVSGGQDGVVRVWDVDTGKEMERIGAEADRVLCVAISADGRYALSGGRDGDVRLWTLGKGEPLTLKGHTNFVRGVAFSPDGRRVLSCGDDMTIRLWDAQTGKLIRNFDKFDGDVRVRGVFARRQARRRRLRLRVRARVGPGRRQAAV